MHVNGTATRTATMWDCNNVAGNNVGLQQHWDCSVACLWVCNNVGIATVLHARRNSKGVSNCGGRCIKARDNVAFVIILCAVKSIYLVLLPWTSSRGGCTSSHSIVAA